MMKNAISHLVPDMPRAGSLEKYLRQIDCNLWYTNFGPLVTKLEGILHEILGGEKDLHVITLSSGHAALEYAIRATLDSIGNKILVPGFTFASTVHAIINTGHTPVLADVDRESWCLTPEIASDLVTAGEKIDAVMPVATFGHPLDCAGWDAFSLKYDIPVIMDAAAAFNAQEIPTKAIVCHSLHATKPFGVGEGGLLITRNTRLAQCVRAASNFGFENRSTQQWGGNAKLSEYHAAVGLAQAERWETCKAKRRDLYKSYRNALMTVGGIRLQGDHPDLIPATLCILLPQHVKREQVEQALAKDNIFSARPYLPSIKQQNYFIEARLLDVHNETPVCDEIAEQMLALPFYPMLDQSDIDRVIKSLRHVLG